MLVDSKNKTLDILELTVPFEGNIKTRHTDKTNKYADFISDIKTHKTTVTAFEVGVRGFLTQDNMERLKDIHKLCGMKIKKRKFLDIISALSITGNYLLFLARKQPTWSSPGYLTHLFKNHTNPILFRVLEELLGI